MAKRALKKKKLGKRSKKPDLRQILFGNPSANQHRDGGWVYGNLVQDLQNQVERLKRERDIDIENIRKTEKALFDDRLAKQKQQAEETKKSSVKTSLDKQSGGFLKTIGKNFDATMEAHKEKASAKKETAKKQAEIDRLKADAKAKEDEMKEWENLTEMEKFEAHNPRENPYNAAFNTNVSEDLRLLRTIQYNPVSGSPTGFNLAAPDGAVSIGGISSEYDSELSPETIPPQDRHVYANEGPPIYSILPPQTPFEAAPRNNNDFYTQGGYEALITHEAGSWRQEDHLEQWGARAREGLTGAKRARHSADSVSSHENYEDKKRQDLSQTEGSIDGNPDAPTRVIERDITFF